MTVSELARRTGVTTATINYYVQRELLPPPEKPSKTRALYTEEHVRVIHYIKRLQANGYSLQLIKKSLDGLGGFPEADSRPVETIGTNYPIPPTRAGPPRPAVIDEPVDRAGFLEITRLTAEQLDQLEKDRILRPQAEGRYDAGDVEVGQHVRQLLDFGMPSGELHTLVELEPAVDLFARTLAWLFQVNDAPLSHRQVRHRDVSDPLFRILDYLVVRTIVARYPETVVAGSTGHSSESEVSG